MSRCWADFYVGLQFHPERNNCWSLVRKVFLDELDIDLPDHAEISADQLLIIARTMVRNANIAPWVRVERPEPFDVVLMSGLSAASPRAPVHVGVIVSPLLMLHTSQETQASCVVALGNLMIRSRIQGFYRHERLATHSGRP